MEHTQIIDAASPGKMETAPGILRCKSRIPRIPVKTANIKIMKTTIKIGIISHRNCLIPDQEKPPPWCCCAFPIGFRIKTTPTRTQTKVMGAMTAM